MIGVGLIGGSFAIDIKKNYPNVVIHGISRKEETLNKALELKLIDKKATLEDLENADLVIVSIPVDATVKLLPTILDKISETGLVVDAGSTKEAICKAVEHHPKRRNFLACHPIAGTEKSGPEAAISGLYVGKTNIICEVEKTTLEYIIRDHDMELFQQRKKHFEKVATDLNRKWEQNLVQVEIKDQYFNMKEKLEPVMHIVDLAEQAMIEVGVTPLIKAIRGGTDGSQLSYKGLPCPNIFAGGHNFHGRYEYVPVESMQKAIEVIVNIAQLIAKQ